MSASNQLQGFYVRTQRAAQNSLQADTYNNHERKVYTMSYQEIAKNMIDHLPEDKLIFVINILENIGEMSGLDLYPDFRPNTETLAAMAETDEMIRTGNGQHFEGTAEAFTDLLLSED